MPGKLTTFLLRLCEEPPFRILAKAVLKRAKCSIETMDNWELTARPHYFTGVRHAAKQALVEGKPEISVIEFGVATGAGLLELEICAARVQQDTGVKINVIGFDSGAGLPALLADHRDHPDWWAPGDYRMDVAKLKSRLAPGTQLVLGNVSETVDEFVNGGDYRPIGFISFDLDLYSSTVEAMKILKSEKRNVLNRVFLYFDDVDILVNHKFAGELLAIDEFNQENDDIKIDRWRGIRRSRPFFESIWLDRMYIAHHLTAISRVKHEYRAATIPGSTI